MKQNETKQHLHNGCHNKIPCKTWNKKNCKLNLNATQLKVDSNFWWFKKWLACKLEKIQAQKQNENTHKTIYNNETCIKT